MSREWPASRRVTCAQRPRLRVRLALRSQLPLDYTVFAGARACGIPGLSYCHGLFCSVTGSQSNLEGDLLHGTRPSLERYVNMTAMWTIIIAWLAIQLPLGILIGKTIKFGTVEPAKVRSPSRDPRYYPGVVWC